MYYAKELAFYVILLTILCGFLMLFLHWIFYPFFIKGYTEKKAAEWRKKLKSLREAVNTSKGATKLTFIGSSQYQQRMKEAADKYREAGYTVYLPAFDDDYDDALTLWGANRELIRAADTVVVFWDQRSTGTIFDIGMAFALEKPVIIGYLEGRTLGTTLVQYAGMKGGVDAEVWTTRVSNRYGNRSRWRMGKV